MNGPPFVEPMRRDAPPSILVLMDHFLPSYKAGGPIRTISSLIQHLGGQYRFGILNRDHDLGVREPLAGVTPSQWIDRGDYDVRYVARDQFLLSAVRRAARERPYDMVYLNSYFSTLSQSALLLRRIGLLERRPFVVAPRGELALNNLQHKSAKKQAFIRLARRIGLFRGVVWHASSDWEREEIERLHDGTVVVSPNLPAPIPVDEQRAPRPPKRPGAARFVALGRVSQLKNLEYSLRQLEHARGEIEFDVYGTAEDAEYLDRCRKRMERMPPNIRCAYRGPVQPDRVHATLSGYHFFLYPTKAENFGHVILEGMLARLPLVISNETFWRDLQSRGAGYDLPLADEAGFRVAIQACVDMDLPAYQRASAASREIGESYVSDPIRVEQARQVFLTALGSRA